MAACVIDALLIALLLNGAQALDNGLALTPPMGWNTWCTLGYCGYDRCNAQEVMSIADTMATNGMKEAGYEYINLDDCWADHREADGTIVPDETRFPGGLVPVIQYVNAKGFKFGVLFCCPIQYTDGGVYTCNKGGRPYDIPGSYGYYNQDAQTYASWGVEYVKMDWCNHEVNGTTLDPKVQYPEMSKALNATGKPILFNSCEWGEDEPWEWMAPYANTWRSGPDHEDLWVSTMTIIEQNVGLSSFAGPGGWNDPDFIMTGGQLDTRTTDDAEPTLSVVSRAASACGDLLDTACTLNPSEHCPGQTDVEYKSEFSIWCLLAAPLIVVTDIRNMTSAMSNILLNQEMIAVDQDKLGKAGDRIAIWPCVQDTVTCQIWAKPLVNNSYAVGLFNSGFLTHSITLQFKLLNFTGNVFLRDLWQHQDLGVFTESFTVDVEPHGIEVYKVTPL